MSASTTHPRVSVGLPVFNGADHLQSAIDSILGQTYSDFELIISNNGSTDATDSICRMNAANDARITYVTSDKNLGAAWNFNKVFALSSGDYFKWAAHDDVLAPAFLDSCLSTMATNSDIVLAYPVISVVDDKGTFIKTLHNQQEVDKDRPSDRFHAFVYHFHWEAIFGLIRSSVLAQTGLIGPYANSDAVLLPELALYGKFHEIPESLLFLRWHSGRSATVYPNIRKRHVWFDTSRSHTRSYPYWRLLYEYMRAVRRAQLPTPENLRCYAHIARWARFNIGELWKDIKP